MPTANDIRVAIGADGLPENELSLDQGIAHALKNNRLVRGKLIDGMPQETRSTETATSRARLPRGFVLLPPVSMDDLKKDTEHDPERAEEFVALIRQLRQPDSRPVKL